MEIEGGDINKNNFKNAIAYIPLVAIALYFTSDEKSLSYQKSIRYGIYFLFIFLFFAFLFTIFVSWRFGLAIMMILYPIFSLVFIFMAYKGKEINIFIIDKIHSVISKMGG